MVSYFFKGAFAGGKLVAVVGSEDFLASRQLTPKPPVVALNGSTPNLPIFNLTNRTQNQSSFEKLTKQVGHNIYVNWLPLQNQVNLYFSLTQRQI